MEAILLEILEILREGNALDEKALAKILNRHNKGLASNEQHHSKKKLLPYYLKTKANRPREWESWQVDEDLERRLIEVLRVKPRRSASGVATITVLTKPRPCSSDCLYCPNDLRMPKSYLSDEPACQRAERNFFDPYLQVASRLRALTHMGHVTDKVELIILGGTWNDYDPAYRIWFVNELFRAMNDGKRIEAEVAKRRAFYRSLGLSNSAADLAAFVKTEQDLVDRGVLSCNQAFSRLYENNEPWLRLAAEQIADFDELEARQRANEHAPHRVVGLVVETRPDTISIEGLTLLRRLGCTKIQMGIQSLDPTVLAMNRRKNDEETLKRAFALVRLFGFKIHTHIMVNLYGSSPEADKAEYLRFVTDPAFRPDEIKLYPCVLVEGTGLCEHFENGSWRPYTEEELLDVLMYDLAVTPRFIRISRMIRDISAHDIIAGNKKVNLRQLVEHRLEESDTRLAEICHREISTRKTDRSDLRLEITPYDTNVSREYFLEWVTSENEIAGFLRLSLPKQNELEPYRTGSQEQALPIAAGEAMIREVHIYGKVAGLHATGEGAQHLGLGKRLIDHAEQIARDKGFTTLNVISAVGTREYYRNLGFENATLYQRKRLL